MKSKYIVYMDSQFQTETIVMFPFWVSHADMARGIGVEAISAGFLTAEQDQVKCTGESTSLGIQSDPERDTKLAQELLTSV